MHKDIRLMLEAAKEARVKLPALEIVEEIYDMAVEDGNRTSITPPPSPCWKNGPEWK